MVENIRNKGLQEYTLGEKKGGEKDFLPSIIILSIIEIPTLIVTLFCMFIKIPQSNSRHIMATALFAFVALIYVLCRKKK